jgi:methylphosphotriester-DNA--protein-cysteine methyltransferase
MAGDRPPPGEESFEDEVERRYQESQRKGGNLGGTFIFAVPREMIHSEVAREREGREKARLRALQMELPGRGRGGREPGRRHRPGRPAKSIDTATVNRVVRLLKEGELSLDDIAAEVGLSRYQVTKIRDDRNRRKEPEFSADSAADLALRLT